MKVYKLKQEVDQTIYEAKGIKINPYSKEQAFNFLDDYMKELNVKPSYVDVHPDGNIALHWQDANKKMASILFTGEDREMIWNFFSIYGKRDYGKMTFRSFPQSELFKFIKENFGNVTIGGNVDCSINNKIEKLIDETVLRYKKYDSIQTDLSSIMDAKFFVRKFTSYLKSMKIYIRTREDKQGNIYFRYFRRPTDEMFLDVEFIRDGKIYWSFMARRDKVNKDAILMLNDFRKSDLSKIIETNFGDNRNKDD